jgi:hypothetical protein
MGEIYHRKDMAAKRKRQHQVEFSGQLYAVPFSELPIPFE